MKLDIPRVLSQLTLEEKAGLCSGDSFWWTKAVERLGIPGVMVTDGPHGLRKQAGTGDHLGLNESVKAVCFPAGSAFASSFDRDLIAGLGKRLGEASRAERVHTLLGPAVNIKRSPLCGRNFEYLSEDPYLAGEMASSYVTAVQSQGVGVSVKHYAANNQEFCRMSTDTVVSERALWEIYLAAFEATVKQSKPWTLMCAYNRLNGTYCCENSWLLDDVLRKEWGFDGIVMTDWGAMNNRVAAMKAGLNLEMPASHGIRDREIVRAVEDGRLSMEVVDRRVEELLRWIDRGLPEGPVPESYDKDEHDRFARHAAAECAVLLKNDDDLLPLDRGDDVVFIGTFAKAPRYQGGGSSHINATRVTGAVEAAGGGSHVRYASGWEDDGVTRNEALLREAVEAAKNARAAVIFAGLPDSFESEGYDRAHMDMPACQNELIEAVGAVQPNTVVVLHAGGPVLMPWIDKARSVLHMYLGGQAVGAAAVDLLFGDAAPAGRLAETYPLRLEDTPAYLSFPGDGQKVVYGEGVFVGYRWYDSRKMPVLFPFGHGLTYTRFALDGLTVSRNEYDGQGTLTVSVRVTNTGKRPGKHVVQLYVAPPAGSPHGRPVHELRAFEKVELGPGESKTVTLELDRRAFTYYEERIGGWRMEGGTCTIEVGSSCRDLPLRTEVQVTDEPIPLVYEDHITVSDLIRAGRQDVLGEALGNHMQQMLGGGDGGVVNQEMMEAMIGGMPLHSMVNFMPMPDNFLDEIREKLNREGTDSK